MAQREEMSTNEMSIQCFSNRLFFYNLWFFLTTNYLISQPNTINSGFFFTSFLRFHPVIWVDRSELFYNDWTINSFQEIKNCFFYRFQLYARAYVRIWTLRSMAWCPPDVSDRTIFRFRFNWFQRFLFIVV